jgi:hypothetical protein
LRIVRPKAKPPIIASDGNDAAVVQDIGHTEIVYQVVIIKLAAW